MTDGKKIIGLCITKIYDETYTEYLKQLRVYAAQHSCKLIVFNSFSDFYDKAAFSDGASSVYSIINYDIMDGIIILYDGFYDMSIPTGIIEKAQAKGIPVVTVNGRHEGCHCIDGDYREEYKKLLRHVIRDHGVTDTFYMAGMKGEHNSEIRINCWREVLEENGIAFSYDNVDYGDYWEMPTISAMERLYCQRRKNMPRAIFCANDTMAMCICKWLSEHNIKVPEDIIVTGFDGVPASEIFLPSITTCYRDLDKMARYTIEIISGEMKSDSGLISVDDTYKNHILESCGCPRKDRSFRTIAQEMFDRLHNMQNHETFIFSSFDLMLGINNMNLLRECLAKYTMECSYVCVNRNLIASFLDPKPRQTFFTEELDVISSDFSSVEDKAEKSTITVKEMVPNFDAWMKDESIYIISSVYVGNHICGYYATRTDNVSDCTGKLKRLDRIIESSFNALLNSTNQMIMRNNIANAALINPLTELYNLKGITNWFDKFASIPENHKKTLAISVYVLPQYKYIYENYGMAEMEKSLRFIADALRSCCENNGIIAHITEDSFIIINITNSPDEIPDIINSTTGLFFSRLDEYRTALNYFLEVNAGCTVVNPGWSGKLSGFVKLANSEMYINRIRYSGTNKESGSKKTEKKDFTENFKILIEHNMFHYFFQPIVDARTGDIFAYEALMRTASEIGMNPLEVLEAAEQQNRLYDVERATMFNVISRYAKEYDKFGGRHIFINSIPGYSLNEDDNHILAVKYSEYLDHFVIEITEQNTLSDDELLTIKHIGNSEKPVPIAVDDYGTGHSNIVNLMRYSPQIVKIDRFLISDVDKDVNKQMFVKSTIEFARMNDMKVLAEGVETAEELKTVISFGVDLVQGYYTGRPAPEPIDRIKDEIRSEILSVKPVTAAV